MGQLNLLTVAIGLVALLVGGGVLAVAIRNRGEGDSPRAAAMLIGGMMLATFGLLMAGFSIGYAMSEPPHSTAEAAQ